MQNIHVGCTITVMTMKCILFGILIISIFSKYEYFFPFTELSVIFLTH